MSDPATSLTTDDATALERCLASGGVAVFPADTVYGLACDPLSGAAVARLYGLKGRPPARPAAVMFFAREPALDVLAAGLGPRTRAALDRLLPGALTVLLPNPGRLFPLACGPAPERVGLRVPALPTELAALTAVERPLLQSSANPSGAADPRRLADVDGRIVAGADLALDGGTLPGTPSTVVDMTSYESDGRFDVLREGAVPRPRVQALLA